MARLYLVRRSLETYLGPWTLQELVQSYKRLEFGLQDEIAGSCGPWISFENLSKIKRYYPEVAKVVENEFLGGWGVSNHSEKTALLKSPSSRKSRRRKSLSFLGFSLFLGVSLTFSFVLLKGARFSGKFGPDTDGLEEMLVDGRNDAFRDRMREVMPAILPKASQSRKIYNEWIPYLRAYAFIHNKGQIEEFPTRLLRGMEVIPGPHDCSLAAWQGVWRDAGPKLQDVLDGKTWAMPQGVQVLFWDVAWLKRRTKNNGWIVPQSYFEACLQMAHKAADALGNENLTSEVKSRLAFILSRINKTWSESINPVTTVTLLTIHCFDNANSAASLMACPIPPALSNEWRSYLTVVKSRNELSVMIKGKNILTEDATAALAKLRKSLPLKDSLTQFIYQPEFDVYDAISSSNGSVKDATKRVQFEYPDVQLVD